MQQRAGGQGGPCLRCPSLLATSSSPRSAEVDGVLFANQVLADDRGGKAKNTGEKAPLHIGHRRAPISSQLSASPWIGCFTGGTPVL